MQDFEISIFDKVVPHGKREIRSARDFEFGSFDNVTVRECVKKFDGLRVRESQPLKSKEPRRRARSNLLRSQDATRARSLALCILHQEMSTPSWCNPRSL